MISKLFLYKEFKKFPFFFFLLFVTLILGALGLSAISVISDQVKSKLESNARELLTSDIVVSARRDLLGPEVLALNNIMKEFNYRTYKVIDIYSMIRHERTQQTRLVEIRSVENGFPFYGNLTLTSGEFRVDGLYISKDLAELWGISLQDEVKVGEKKFVVKGIVQSDSSQGLRGFSLAPRIYLPLEQVEQAGLLRPGSTGSFARHFQIPGFSSDDFDKLKDRLLKAISDVAVKVILPQESSEQSGRVLAYLTDFMSLSALVGLLLSLVGVFYLYQSHLAARLKDLCLFNLLGLEKRSIVWGLILQFTVIFIFVFLIQGLIIYPLYQWIRPLLSNALGLELSESINLTSVFLQLPFLYGLTLSVLIPLLFGLLRTPMGLQLKSSKISLGRFRFFDFGFFIILLWAFAVFLGHSFKIGSLFFLGLVVVFTFSAVFIRFLQWSIKKLISQKTLLNPNIETGVSLRNILHSGHKLTLSFLSLSMAATLISLILQLDYLIQNEFILDEKKPSLFIFDIQEDQIDPLYDFARRKGLKLEGVTPMIRARLEKVNGKAFSRQLENSPIRTREDEVESRFKNRGINLTYRGQLSDAEKLVEGEPFPREQSSVERAAFVSLEKRFAQRMGLHLGDRVTFDVQGVEVDGVIRNFREVKWTSFYPNFFVNVEPGFLDEAPKTYLAVLPQGDKELKLKFQREAVGEFPNVSFIDVEELISKISVLFDKSRQAMEMISWLSLAVGLVILYGLSHDQVYRRSYDLALMKAMGFGRQSLQKQILIEFGLVFSLATSLGLLLGWMMALLIGREVFKVSWNIDWPRMIYPALLLSVLCLVTILLASWRAVRARPRVLLSDA